MAACNLRATRNAVLEASGPTISAASDVALRLLIQDRGGTPMTATLLDLVTAVSRYSRTEAETIATVVYLVNSGKVTLCGNFRGARFDCDAEGLREVAA